MLLISGSKILPTISEFSCATAAEFLTLSRGERQSVDRAVPRSRLKKMGPKT